MLSNRHAALDVARIIAAAVVLVHHAKNPMGLDYGPLTPSLGHAVFVFFSLSGFLVFRPFVRGPVPTGAHVVRRLARIFPAYLVALLVTLALSDPYPAGRELQYALMLQAPSTAKELGVVSVAWSLHVEVVFYLALPLLAAVLAAVGSHRRRAALLVVLGLASMAVWQLLAPLEPASPARPLMAPMMLWAFVPGMLVAMALERSPALAARLARRTVLVAGAVVLSLAVFVPAPPGAEVVALLAAATGTALMIPGLLAMPSRTGVGWMAAAGRTCSYPVYLWHVVVVVMVAGVGVTGWVGVSVALAIALVFGAASWLLVERPAMAAADALLRARARQSSVSASERWGSVA